MNLMLTRSTALPLRPLGLAAAVVLSSVLLAVAASLALTAGPEPVPPPVLAPVPTAPVGDTGVPDAATALRDAPEPVGEPVPGF